MISIGVPDTLEYTCNRNPKVYALQPVPCPFILRSEPPSRTSQAVSTTPPTTCPMVLEGSWDLVITYYGVTARLIVSLLALLGLV